MARWEEALDSLLGLYVDWNSEAGKWYADRWLKQWLEGLIHGKDTDYAKAAGNIWADFYPRMSNILWQAEPIYIDPDMMTIVESAYPDFEPEALVPSDLITPFGFMALPRPFYYKFHSGPTDEDVQEPIKQISFRYILWGIETHKFDSGASMEVLLLSVWRSPLDKDDIDNDSDVPQLAILIPWQMDGKTIYYDYSKSREVNELGQWFQVAQKVQTIWRLMMQTISVKTTMQANRAARKRVERAKYAEKQITVITLRRPKGEPSGEHREVNWTHRWLVGKHWRWHWYAIVGHGMCGHVNNGVVCTMEGGVHRQILILPYIKGDPSLPLVVRKERVWNWTR